MCVHVCVRTCMCVRAFEHICVRVYLRAHVRTWELIRDTAHEAVHVPVCMCASGRACVCGLSNVRVCVRACVRVLYAYMIYHIGLCNMIVTMAAWGPSYYYDNPGCKMADILVIMSIAFTLLFCHYLIPFHQPMFYHCSPSTLFLSRISLSLINFPRSPTHVNKTRNSTQGSNFFYYKPTEMRPK